VVSLEGTIYIVLYYLSASEFWPDDRSGLWWEGPYKRETIVSTVSYDWSYQKVMLMKNSYDNSSYSFRKPEATKIIF
jgi:hypothetical protein